MNKIKIYHGSLEKVIAPEIRVSNRTLDYGCGFYTTTDYRQAKDWVTRHSQDKKKPLCGYVNIYEVDFVYANRNDRMFIHTYDFVYGPVANDKVYAAFALYEAGLLNKQELIRQLKTYKLVDQLLMHTTEAITAITFVEAKEIKL